MPVTDLHPDYEKNLPLWERCRTAISGEDAVKAAGMKYLPALEEQKAGEYSSYLMRAMFYSASGRTVKGLMGSILRKEPEENLPDDKKDLFERISSKGESLAHIRNVALEEAIGLGRMGLLVDSAGEGAEPYIATYWAENITNWRTEMIGGRERLTMVVLREDIEAPGEDEFSYKPETRYRVLKLSGGVDEDDPSKRVYSVQIYTKSEVSKDGAQPESWVAGPAVFPKMSGGREFDAIPFRFVNPCSADPEPESSPILDLVNVNLSHYRNSADLEHGRHYTALPTAVAAGWHDKDAKLKIGSSVAWIATDPAAHAEFLEFTGAGLNHLKEGMEHKERLMAVLGARLLEAQKAGVEAADTVKLRHSGEQSALSTIAQAVSSALTDAIRIVLDWVGTLRSSQYGITLNTDFNTEGLTSDQIAALVASWQQRAISWPTLYFNLKRGEIYPDDLTEEDEAALIAEGGPAGRVPGEEGGSEENGGPGSRSPKREVKSESSEGGDRTGEGGSLASGAAGSEGRAAA